MEDCRGAGSFEEDEFNTYEDLSFCFMDLARCFPLMGISSAGFINTLEMAGIKPEYDIL